MSLTLTSKSCGKVIAAAGEDGLVVLGQEHAREHGQTKSLPRAHVLDRIRRHNRKQPEG